MIYMAQTDNTNKLMCLNAGRPKTINFPLGTNGKLMFLGVPILKHFREYKIHKIFGFYGPFKNIAPISSGPLITGG